MNHKLKVAKGIVINAPAYKVWDALTEPEIIAEYLFGTETITDWEVGSGIIFQGDYMDTKYKDKGVVVSNVFLEELSYRYWSAFTGLEDAQENYSLVTYTLVSQGPNQTELTWAQEGFASEEGYQHSLQGMDAFMKQIKEIVER